MSTITDTARRVAGHPVTRSVVRCAAGCALVAVRAALGPRAGAHTGAPNSSRIAESGR